MIEIRISPTRRWTGPAWRIAWVGLGMGLLGAILPVQGGGNPASGWVWPTPNPAFLQGADPSEYLQPTVSGRVESGAFGCTRNHRQRFHEGVDLKPISRDRRREATDPVYSVMDGTVVYINTVAGNSSYGRYVVVEHDGTEPAVHTLYAHLRSIRPEIEVGGRVRAGETLGIMGRSAGGYVIPRERAHLHFEIGVRLTDRFQAWYDRQGFGSANHHGSWNGMNLVGIDPLDFYRVMQEGTAGGPAEYISAQAPAFKIRVFRQSIPDFIQRYPSLLRADMRDEPLVAWDIEFTWYHLPMRWTPRYLSDGISGAEGELHLLAYDRELLEAHPCRDCLRFGADERVLLGAGTRRMLELLFVDG